MKGYLRKIIPFSSVDGPGNRTGIFLQGCNFNCKNCHNPETIPIASDKNVIDDIKYVDVEEIVEEVIKYKDFTRGVTISGGECTVQFDFLLEICRNLKSKNINIFIDTNGYIRKDKLEQLSQVVDRFMFDLKVSDNGQHKMLTGKSNETVIENIIDQMKQHKVFEIRTVVIPELLDNEKTVEFTSRLINQYDSKVRYKLIKFRNLGVTSELKDKASPKQSEMEKLREVAYENGAKDVVII